MQAMNRAASTETSRQVVVFPYDAIPLLIGFNTSLLAIIIAP